MFSNYKYKFEDFCKYLQKELCVKYSVGRDGVKSSPAQVLADVLLWRQLPDCPAALLDAGRAQLGNLLYVICGFESLEKVSNTVHVLDLTSEKWLPGIPAPLDLPNTHFGVSHDSNRYIYIAGGQLGPNCSPAVPTVYCFDANETSWHLLPALPASRYAGSLQLWNGRLHFIGGADEDRWTARAEHWSIAVAGSSAMDSQWRNEKPIPVPGMHRGIALVDDHLYVLGGQQGDFIPIPDDPDYTCTGKTQENYLQSVFRLSRPGGDWERMPDLPIAVSHCDFSCIVIDGIVYVAGGQIYKHPEEFYLKLTNTIQAYDTDKKTWSIAGYLPYHVKMPLLGYLEGKIFLTVGQKGQGEEDSPGELTSQTWQSIFPGVDSRTWQSKPDAVNGKNVLLVSHELSRTGAPLELLELGSAMMAADATVRLVTLGGDSRHGDLASNFRLPLVPVETAFQHAETADLIVVNTVDRRVKAWVRSCLDQTPGLAAKIIWLIHEIDTDKYKDEFGTISRVRAAVFDSSASMNAWKQVEALPDNVSVVHPGLRDEMFERTAREKLPFLPASINRKDTPPIVASRAEIRAHLGVKDDEFLILSVGSVCEVKGQKLLWRTIARAAKRRNLPLKLALVGFLSRSQRARFLRTLDQGAKRVLDRRAAFLNSPFIEALYRASDCHVLNTQGRNAQGETFGRVTLEAMSFGLPVLGTNAGGTVEIIQDGVQGFLYPTGPAGQEVLIDKIEFLVRNPEIVEKIGRAAKSRVENHFSKAIYLKEIDRVFSDVLEN